MSTNILPGDEGYETFSMNKDLTMYLYVYKHTDGNVFKTMASTLEVCRTRCYLWIKRNYDR